MNRYLQAETLLRCVLCNNILTVVNDNVPVYCCQMASLGVSYVYDPKLSSFPEMVPTM